MKTLFIALLVGIISLSVVGGVEAKTLTQCDYALALAQILGLEATSGEEAIKMFTEDFGDFPIQPAGGWKCEDLMTASLAEEIDRAVARAVAAGLLAPKAADGAVVAAASATGLAYGGGPAAPKLDIPAAPVGGAQGDNPRIGSPFRP